MYNDLWVYLKPLLLIITNSFDILSCAVKAKGGKQEWQKFVLARTSRWIPHSSVSSVRAQETAYWLRFAKESITKSLL